MTICHHDILWLYIYYDDGMPSRYVMIVDHHEISSQFTWCIVMIHHHESSWIIMMNHDGSSLWIMMIYHYASPCGSERIPFRPAMAPQWAPWIYATHLFTEPTAFLQTETLKMGIATANGGDKKQLSAHSQTWLPECYHPDWTDDHPGLETSRAAPSRKAAATQRKSGS